LSRQLAPAICADHQVASDVEGSILIVGVTIRPQTIGDVIT
jgi:hypothetical protein